MKKYNTTALISELQERIEVVLQKAVSNWQNQSEEKLLFSYSPEKWNAAQCLAHLNSYGKYYLPAIEKAIANAKGTPRESFKSSWLGNYFYETMLPANLQKNGKQKKMKSPKNHVPAKNTDASAAVAEFINQSENLLLLLEKSRSINISDSKVPISIAKFIKLQLGDVFLFLVAHIERHTVQAENMMLRFDSVNKAVV